MYKTLVSMFFKILIMKARQYLLFFVGLHLLKCMWLSTWISSVNLWFIID